METRITRLGCGRVTRYWNLISRRAERLVNRLHANRGWTPRQPAERRSLCWENFQPGELRCATARH